MSDAWHASRLIEYLKNDYKGGPIAVGSDRFEQGLKGKPDWLPVALAACEGPPVEVSLSLAHWLQEHDKGSAKNITIFTPAELIAEDAGEKVVGQLLDAASSMGFGYVNKVEGIERLTENGIEFRDGRKLDAEISIVLPNWKPHAFLEGLPISDEVGFMFPYRGMPLWAQWLGEIFPLTHFNRMIRSVMLKGADAQGVSGPLWALGAFALIFALAALLRFRRTLD